MATPQLGALPATPTTQAFGDAAAKGVGPGDALEDHKHAWPALGTTAAAIGTSAGGSATTPSKSDHVHATGAGTPSTQAFGDAAATGSGPAAAMTDHKHAMPATPVGIAQPGPITGKAAWYGWLGQYGGGAVVSLGLNALYASPVWLVAGAVIDRFGINVTGAVTSAACRMGLYADAAGIPSGAALVDSGSIAAATTGFKSATVSYTVPTTGWYWLAYVSQGAQPNVSTSGAVRYMLGDTGATPSGVHLYGYKHNGTVSGALPTWSQLAAQTDAGGILWPAPFYRIT